jgi:hypothetical protein
MLSGKALSVNDIKRICRRSYTPIIFMAGETACGKTTLIASLHDAFLFGPLSGFHFAGSETLYAFEERSFESRASSSGIEPDTARTRYENGQEYFHLQLREQGSGSVKEVLFADMSGEFYERSLYSKSEVSQFKDLRRAQILLLLLDGAKLVDPATRQPIRANAMQFLRRCFEERMLSEDTILQILISKWDIVRQRSQAEQDACMNFVTSRLNEKSLARQVQVAPVASRPGIGRQSEKLFGIRDLFPIWVRTVPVALHASPKIDAQVDEASGCYNKFKGIIP